MLMIMLVVLVVLVLLLLLVRGQPFLSSTLLLLLCGMRLHLTLLLLPNSLMLLPCLNLSFLYFLYWVNVFCMGWFGLFLVKIWEVLNFNMLLLVVTVLLGRQLVLRRLDSG